MRRNLLLRATTELAHLHGFQSSAYRNVRLGPWTAQRSDGSDPEEGAWIFSGVTGSANERHPRERFQQTRRISYVRNDSTASHQILIWSNRFDRARSQVV